MYFSHSGQTVKKEVKADKEVRMTSAHGNKTVVLSVFICLSAFAFLSGAIIAEKKARLKLYEKKYSAVLSSLKAENKQICIDNRGVFIDEND